MWERTTRLLHHLHHVPTVTWEGENPEEAEHRDTGSSHTWGGVMRRMKRAEVGAEASREEVRRAPAAQDDLQVTAQLIREAGRNLVPSTGSGQQRNAPGGGGGDGAPIELALIPESINACC